jgi:sulfur-carrier protein
VVKAHLWSGLRRLTGGVEVVEVEARTIREMLDALVAAHPALKPVIAAGVSVAIDGAIVPNLHHTLVAGDDVFLMQRIKGG